ALGFMDATALMGYGGQATQELSQAQVDQIRVDMAINYLLTLIEIAGASGFVDRDINFEEAKAFHKSTFERHGLTLDNWTLTIPFDLIEANLGNSLTETIWELLRDTGG